MTGSAKVAPPGAPPSDRAQPVLTGGHDDRAVVHRWWQVPPTRSPGSLLPRCSSARIATIRKDASMNRRDFLRSAVVVSASVALPKTAGLFAQSPAPGNWRTFEVTTRVEVLTSPGMTRVWLPAALIGADPFPADARKSVPCRGRYREDRPNEGRSARNCRRGISRGREAGPHAHQPDRNKRLCR